MILLPKLTTKNIIIITAFLIILIVIIVAVIFFRGTANNPIQDDPIKNAGESLPQVGNIGTDINAPVEASLGGVSITSQDYKDQVTLSEIRTKSEIYLERLGSYSSDSDLNNMNDLYNQMTELLAAQINSKRKLLLDKYKSSLGFEGQATIPITSEVTNYDLEAGLMTVKIQAQKTVQTDLVNNGPIYSEYFFNWLKNENGRWRLNEIQGDF